MSKKIIILCHHPKNVVPGQRLKYEQYFDSRKDEGYAITLSSFMSLRYWNIVYLKGHLLEKIFWTIVGYLKRYLFILFSKHIY